MYKEKCKYILLNFSEGTKNYRFQQIWTLLNLVNSVATLKARKKDWDTLVQWARVFCLPCPILNPTCPMGNLERTERTSTFYGLSGGK